MLSKLRSRLTYANVMSTLGVFIALGTGGAYASHELINSSDVVDDSLTSADIQNRTLTTSDLGIGSVWGSRIKDNGVLGSHVVDNTLTGNDINEATLQLGAEAWNEVTPTIACEVILGNSWQNFGGANSTLAYFRDRFGVVHIKGTVKCPIQTTGVPGRRIFDLPDGYAPLQTENFPSNGNGGGARLISVDSGGLVEFAAGTLNSEEALYLDGISFRCQPSGSNGCP